MSLTIILLIFGFIRRYIKNCPKDIKNICVLFYLEKACFYNKTENYKFKNNGKTIISKPSPYSTSVCHCNNFVIYTENRLHRWTFQINCLPLKAKINCGIMILFPTQGNVGLFYEIKKLKKTFKENDLIDIYLSFKKTEANIFVCINGDHCPEHLILDDGLLFLNKFSAALKTKRGEIELTLTDYISMCA